MVDPPNGKATDEGLLASGPVESRNRSCNSCATPSQDGGRRRRLAHRRVTPRTKGEDQALQDQACDVHRHPRRPCIGDTTNELAQDENGIENDRPSTHVPETQETDGRGRERCEPRRDVFQRRIRAVPDPDRDRIGARAPANRCPIQRAAFLVRQINPAGERSVTSKEHE